MVDASTQGITSHSLPVIDFDDLFLQLDEFGSHVSKSLSNFAAGADTRCDECGPALEEGDILRGTLVCVQFPGDTSFYIGEIQHVLEDKATVQFRHTWTTAEVEHLCVAVGMEACGRRA